MAKVTMTPALGAAGGSMSNLSFVRQSDGTTSMRERKGGRQPGTKGQRAGQSACQRMVAAWQDLDDDARQAWEEYSSLLHELGPTPSLSRPRAGYRVFSSLGLKALQATPGMAVPALPPSAPFYGDGARVVVTVTPSFHSGERKGPGDRESGMVPHNSQVPLRTPSTLEETLEDPLQGDLASPPSADPPTVPPSARASLKGEPSLVFTCLAPNSPGVATELLVQPLASPGRKGEADKYRSRGFVTFAAAGETADVPCAAGTVMVAVRFVELASGQASGIVPLGRLRVG